MALQKSWSELANRWNQNFPLFSVFASSDDNKIYNNNYYYNQYDLEYLAMSDDCRTVDDLLQLIALKSKDNSYVLNSIVGAIKGYTGFDPRIRTQREELACDIASMLQRNQLQNIMAKLSLFEIPRTTNSSWKGGGGIAIYLLPGPFQGKTSGG